MDIHVNALAFKQGDLWIVQGIEFDIVARANDLDSVPTAFTRALVANACVSQHLGREPLEGVPQAPDEFREMFERAKTEVRGLDVIPEGGVVPGSIRLAPAQAF